MRCVFMARRFRRGAHMVWSWMGDPDWMGVAPEVLPSHGPVSLVLGPHGVTVSYHDGTHAGPFDDMGNILDALGPVTEDTEDLANAAYRFLSGHAS